MPNGNGAKEPKPIKSWAILPKEGIVLVTGDIDEGKSATAWWLAEQHHAAGGRVAAYDIPKQARRALPKWVNTKVASVKDLARLRYPHLVVVDESAINANARRAMSEDNVDWTKLAAIVRHKGHKLFHIAQHNRQPDPALVTAARIGIMKRPSILHLRFSRPELLPELKEAYNLFSRMPGNTRKKAFLVNYRNGATGLLTTHMPSFWSEELSRAFASVDFDDMDGPQPNARGTGNRRTRRSQ